MFGPILFALLYLQGFLAPAPDVGDADFCGPVAPVQEEAALGQVGPKKFGNAYGCWSPSPFGFVSHFGEGVPLAGNTVTMVATPLTPGARFSWIASVHGMRIPCLPMATGQFLNVNMPIVWLEGETGAEIYVGANGRAEVDFLIPAFMAGGGWTIYSQIWAWDGVGGDIIASTKGIWFVVP